LGDAWTNKMQWLFEANEENGWTMDISVLSEVAKVCPEPEEFRLPAQGDTRNHVQERVFFIRKILRPDLEPPEGMRLPARVKANMAPKARANRR
jgi:hypothetical protein